MYRHCNGILEVLLVHPGGPYWEGKDLGAWSIPKGLFTDEESALDAARLGDEEKLRGFERLHNFIRATEFQCDPVADFDAALAHEHAISTELDGRSVFDGSKRGARQMRLF